MWWHVLFWQGCFRSGLHFWTKGSLCMLLFLARYSTLCLCERSEGDKLLGNQATGSHSTVWGHSVLTFRGKVCLEEAVSLTPVAPG